MGLGIRAVEGALGAVAVLFTLLWGLLAFLGHDSVAAFIDAMVPFPLLVPLIIGLLTILNIEVFVQLQAQKGDLVTETEKQAVQTLTSQAPDIIDWNSRWDDKEQE